MPKNFGTRLGPDIKGVKLYHPDYPESKHLTLEVYHEIFKRNYKSYDRQNKAYRNDAKYDGSDKKERALYCIEKKDMFPQLKQL